MYYPPTTHQSMTKLPYLKNWLGRKGLHYIESITEAEKQACNTLQGLFNTLSTKFQLQFNETIKSLQFRKLYRSEDESAEQWMGQLCMAAAECGYKEIDRQLKEQFIHSLNDKSILDEIIRELTSRKDNMQTRSEEVLAWAKRFEAQRVQASMLNEITKTKAFDKGKKETESKNTRGREAHVATHQRQLCRYCGGSHTPRQCLAYGKMCAACDKMGHFRKVRRSKRNHTVHEVEIDMEPESQGEGTEVVSINSLYINRKRSLIIAKLEMQMGKTALEIPYKIDTGSEGNLMPLYIF